MSYKNKDQFRVVVAGLGVQGYKRKIKSGTDFIASVDPVNPEADFKDIQEVDLDSYDAVLCCIPDEPKVELISYLLSNQKHVLVEKPLWANADSELEKLEKQAKANEVFLYTAYNHRFEPHYIRVKEVLDSGELGEIYRCRMFYGNGTARLVRDSAWRDKGSGVLHDLGSHLLDTAKYWFDDFEGTFRVISSNCFENNAPDHVVIGSNDSKPRLEFEMTLLSWRNFFTCDIFAEKGSMHIESLCKWGPASFVLRKRMLPSGRPKEERTTLIQEDPTWEAEYKHFKDLCLMKAQTSLETDIWINKTLQTLGELASDGLQ